MTAIAAHLDALYRTSRDGRSYEINQWDAGEPPRFHLTRSQNWRGWRLRHDLDTELAAALEALVAAEPLGDPRAEPLLARQARALLTGATEGPPPVLRFGPVFRFPEVFPDAPHAPLPPGAEVRALQLSDGNLLSAMPDWLPDLPHRHPFLVALLDGQALAVCASVRITARAHEAGVETHPDARRQGLARAVVAAWARAVRDLGAEPLYSTSWDNSASQAVAQSLGLRLIGTDWSLT